MLSGPGPYLLGSFLIVFQHPPGVKMIVFLYISFTCWLIVTRIISSTQLVSSCVLHFFRKYIIFGVYVVVYICLSNNGKSTCFFLNSHLLSWYSLILYLGTIFYWTQKFIPFFFFFDCIRSHTSNVCLLNNVLTHGSLTFYNIDCSFLFFVIWFRIVSAKSYLVSFGTCSVEIFCISFIKNFVIVWMYASIFPLVDNLGSVKFLTFISSSNLFQSVKWCDSGGMIGVKQRWMSRSTRELSDSSSLGRFPVWYTNWPALIIATSRMSVFLFKSVGYLIGVIRTVMVISSLSSIDLYNNLLAAFSALLFHVWYLVFKLLAIITFVSVSRSDFKSSIWRRVLGLLYIATSLSSLSLVYMCMAMLVIEFVDILNWWCINFRLKNITIGLLIVYVMKLEVGIVWYLTSVFHLIEICRPFFSV